MASLSSTPTEVVALILEYVDDTSPRTMKSVAQVNKNFYSIRQMIAHRHKTIRLYGEQPSDSSLNIIQLWREDETLCLNLRSLTVIGRLYEDRDEDDQDPYEDEAENGSMVDEDIDEDIDGLDPEQVWTQLAALIAGFKKLERLAWNSPNTIPLVVLDAVERHHGCSLEMFDFTPPNVNEPNTLVHRLSASKALTHIRTRFGYEYRRADVSARELAFRCIVGRAPRLVYAGLLHDGYYPDVDIEKDKEAFYCFIKRPNRIRALTLESKDLTEDTLRSWALVLDLSVLESLKYTRGIPSPSYFQHAGAMLSGLKHVSLNFREWTGRKDVQARTLVSAARQYLYNCSPLETLSVWSWSTAFTVDEVLRQHGPTLRSLHLHEREENRASQMRRLLSVSELESVEAQCPRLREFTLDLDRSDPDLKLEDGDPTMDYYEVLKRMCRTLHLLQVYFDYGRDTHDYNQPPPLPRPVPVSTPTYRTTNDNGDVSGDDDGNMSDIEYQRRKRRRTEPVLPPSNGQATEKYALDMWKLLFGQSYSGRKLDVKFGEWESAQGSWSTLSVERTRYYRVRPVERDDQAGQCQLRVVPPRARP